MKAIVDSGRDFDHDIALTFLHTDAAAPGAGLGDNPALAVAAWAGGNVGEAPKDVLLHPAYLSAAVTVGALAGWTIWRVTSTLAQRAVLSAGYIYLLFDTKGCLLEGDGNPVAEVGTGLWRLAGGRSCPAKEGIKDITKAAEIKSLKASPEEPFTATVSKAVIGSAFIRVGEHFVGFVYLLKPLLSSFLVVMVRMIAEGQLTKSLLYFYLGSISVYAEDFIIVPFCWNIYKTLSPLSPSPY